MDGGERLCKVIGARVGVGVRVRVAWTEERLCKVIGAIRFAEIWVTIWFEYLGLGRFRWRHLELEHLGCLGLAFSALDFTNPALSNPQTPLEISNPTLSITSTPP